MVETHYPKSLQYLTIKLKSKRQNLSQLAAFFHPLLAVLMINHASCIRELVQAKNKMSNLYNILLLSLLFHFIIKL